MYQSNYKPSLVRFCSFLFPLNLCGKMNFAYNTITNAKKRKNIQVNTIQVNIKCGFSNKEQLCFGALLLHLQLFFLLLYYTILLANAQLNQLVHLQIPSSKIYFTLFYITRILYYIILYTSTQTKHATN